MDEAEKQSGLEIRQLRPLSLIDVSSEDDCLIDSAFFSPPHHPFSESQVHKSVKFLEPFEALETTFNSPEVREEESQPVESLESGETRGGKYNLRKSLAWDTAFFTSEGVLDSEELSSMIGGTEKSEKRVLPGIQEDIQRSTDSLSTLGGETLTIQSSEADLFKDIRASIQKSSRVSNVANSNNEKKLGVTDSQTIQSSKNADLAPQDKMKPKIACRKPSAGTRGPGKAAKKTSVHPQSSQSVVANGELTSSPGKPPKAHGRINLIPEPTISTKRASMGANHAKLEKHNQKSASGKGVPTSKIPSSGLRNVFPGPTLPSRSSLHSSAATKTELTTSCSSIGSSGSASSDSIGKISVNSMKRKINSGVGNASSTGPTVKSISRTALKGKIQSGSSRLTAHLSSVTKHSTSISPASSISEWSSESIASTSTANQRCSSIRASVDSSSSKSVSVDNDALQGECLKGASMKTGSISCPSSKPSGLRLPSPKIGFFDGVRSTGRTPKRSPGVSRALPKTGAGSTSPSGGSNKSRLGKTQPARTALPVRNIKPHAQQTAMMAKPVSPLPHQDSITVTKVSSASKNVKSPLGSSRYQSRMSPKTGGESVQKAEKVGSKGHHISTQNSSLAVKKGNSSVLKQNMSPNSNSRANKPDSKFTTVKEGLQGSRKLSSTSDAENINPSQQVGEGAKFGEKFLNNDSGLLHNSNEKDKVHLEDQVNDLTKQVGAMDINLDKGKKVVSFSPESILAEKN